MDDQQKLDIMLGIEAEIFSQITASTLGSPDALLDIIKITDLLRDRIEKRREQSQEITDYMKAQLKERRRD